MSNDDIRKKYSAIQVYNQGELLDNLFGLQKIFEDAANQSSVLLNSLSEDAMVNGTTSTGILMMDLLMGGGHLPGRFTYFYGPSGSCKSTTLYASIREALEQGIKVVFLDYEASTDPSYLRKLGIDVEASRGVRSAKGWAKVPSLLHVTPLTAESGFGAIQTMLKSIPDKIMMQDEDELRYFLVDPYYDYRQTWPSIKKGLKDGKIHEVEDGRPQVIFMVDSLRMLTEAKEEDNSKEMIAMLARALHSCFSLIKAPLGRKMCNLICTNHLNINPMAKFGNPETEPGGKAVEFFPDVKIKLMVNRAQSKVISEPHVSGEGLDRYLAGTATVIKNKGGPVMRKMDYRVWIDEKGEPGRGFCPVYDLFQFLLSTNQMNVLKEDSFMITFPGIAQPAMKYGDFKRWALTTEEGKGVYEAAKKQLRDGTAQKLYYQNIKSGALDEAAKKKAKKLAAVNKVEDDALTSSDDDDEKLELPAGDDEVAF